MLGEKQQLHCNGTSRNHHLLALKPYFLKLVPLWLFHMVHLVACRVSARWFQVAITLLIHTFKLLSIRAHYLRPSGPVLPSCHQHQAHQAPLHCFSSCHFLQIASNSDCGYLSPEGSSTKATKALSYMSTYHSKVNCILPRK